MNPLIQLNRRLQYSFIALLLACFATTLSAITVTPEPDGGYPNGNAAEEDNALLDFNTGTPTPAPSFPLKKSANGRYLTYQDGTPFFLVGDSAWYLPVQGTNADIDTYLTNRASKGFNTVLVAIIDNHYSDNAPNNIDGVAPFTVPGNFSTANPAYFNRVDYILTQANDRGMNAIVFPLFLGVRCGDDGWANQVLADTTAHIQSYGTFLGNRYKNFGNIIWVMGGDTDPQCASGLAAKVDAFATALTTADPNHPVTEHNSGRNEAVTPWLPNVPSWLNLNSVYGPSPLTFTQGQTAWNRTPTRPFFLIEAYYEHDPHVLTRAQLRNEEYWALLSGCSGFMFGSCPIWGLSSDATLTHCTGLSNTDWRQNLDTTGASDVTRTKNLFTSIAWQTMVPDFNHTVVTSGFGTGNTTVTTSRASDGSFVISYLPAVSGITVNLTRLSGSSVAARWYDPSNGTYSTVAGSPFPNTGTHVFTPTGNNSSGASDWVLLLQRRLEQTSSAIGLIAIITLYIAIGVMSAAGSVYIAKSIFSPKIEQIFFALFLIPIAGFYLAFTAYFGDKDAWWVEATAVAVFAVFGLVGVRVSFALIVGYLLHGLWDAVHEFNALTGGSLLGSCRTTSVPLGYGFFCATYDFLMTIYFYTRRDQWRAAWSARRQ